MYKAIQNKKYYLAVNQFPNTRKKISKVYRSGFRYWKSDDMFNYSVVIGTFRIIFGVKRENLDCCA